MWLHISSAISHVFVSFTIILSLVSLVLAVGYTPFLGLPCPCGQVELWGGLGTPLRGNLSRPCGPPVRPLPVRFQARGADQPDSDSRELGVKSGDPHP